MIQVRCDGCQATFEMDERRIPKTGMRVRCPKCGAGFQVLPTGATIPAAAPATPGVPARAATKLEFGELDDLALPDEVALPAPARRGHDGVADLPAPIAPRPPPSPPPAAAPTASSDLPAVKPAAVVPPAGVADLPAPLPPRPGAKPPTAPAPTPPAVATPTAARADLPAVKPAAVVTPAGVTDLPAPLPPRPGARPPAAPVPAPTRAPVPVPTAGPTAPPVAKPPPPVIADLPAPAKGAADLPALATARRPIAKATLPGVVPADLPALAPPPGVTDLPAAVSPRPVAKPPTAPVPVPVPTPTPTAPPGATVAKPPPSVIADLPALAKGTADLPAPAKGAADLPALAAARRPAAKATLQGVVPADLPAPSRTSGTAPHESQTRSGGGVSPDLSALGLDDFADLPAPAPAGSIDLPSVGRPAVTDLPARSASTGGADLPALSRTDEFADLPALSPLDEFADLPASAVPSAFAGEAALPTLPKRDAAKSLDLEALDDPPEAAGLPAKSTRAAHAMDLDDPFGRTSDQGLDLADPPAERPSTPSADLPSPRPVDLPANRGGGKLGRVVLEKRAVPASALANIGLPANLGNTSLPVVATGVGLPVPASGAGLPVPATGAGLPVPATGTGLPSPIAAGLPVPTVGTGLPSPIAAGLPAPTMAAGLPAARDFDLDVGLPARQTDGGGFGELDLPLTEAPPPDPLGHDDPFAGPSAVGTSAPRFTPALIDNGFALPLPPGSAPEPAPQERGRVARSTSGGVGFGEISLGNDGPEEEPPSSAVGEEFDQLRLEPAAGTAAGSGSGLDTAIPVRDLVGIAPTATRPQRLPFAEPAALEPPPSRRLYALLGVVGAVVVGGASLSLTAAGPFGVNLIDERINGPARHAAAARTIAAATAELEHDTFSHARRALQNLDAQLARTPAEAGLAAYDTLAYYMVLARFGNEAAVVGRARSLFEKLPGLPAGTSYVPAARAAHDLVAGHAAEARRGVTPADPVTRDLVTMALLEGDDGAAALDSARAGATRHATPRSRYLQARALLLADDRAGARREAEALLRSEPEHAGARLLLAKLLSEHADERDRGLALAGEVEHMATDASREERTEAAVLIGQVEYARERIGPAREAYERALVLDPRSSLALDGAGTILYRQGNFTDALARFQAAQSADGGDLDAKLGVAMASLSLGRAQDARTVLEPLVHDHADDARGHFWLAKAVLALNDQTLAEREFREAIRLDNTNLDAYMSLAGLLFTMQRADAAEQVLEDARGHVSDQAAVHRALGEARAARAALPAAETEYRAALALRPDDARTHFGLAQTLRRERRFDDAQRELETLARLSADYPELLIERGALAEARGDAQGALGTFRAALGRDPTNPQLIVRVAAALVATSQYAEADAQLASFVVDHPNIAEAQYVLGRARLAQGNVPDAVHMLGRATELDAQRADFRAYAAQGFLAALQFDRALEQANQAIILDPGYARGYWVRGEVRVRQGRVLEAAHDAAEALRLDPTLAEANVTLADAYESRGQRPDAITLYRRAVALQTNHGEWWAHLGRLLGDNGQVPDAVAAYERATGLGDPVNPPPSWLAQAHREVGDLVRDRDHAVARRHYERFLELSPPSAPGVPDVRTSLRDLGSN